MRDVHKLLHTCVFYVVSHPAQFSHKEYPAPFIVCDDGQALEGRGAVSERDPAIHRTHKCSLHMCINQLALQ